MREQLKIKLEELKDDSLALMREYTALEEQVKEINEQINIKRATFHAVYSIEKSLKNILEGENDDD